MSLAERARRRTWRSWYGVKRRLLPYRGHRGPVTATVAGIAVRVVPGVFDPARYFSSELLAQAVRAEPLVDGSTVLDLGTGSGILALVAAERAGRVVATDVDQRAVQCAAGNASTGGFANRLELRCGDLWCPVAGERFDLVVCNPPYQVGEPADPLDVAFHAPPSFGERFAAGLTEHLQPGGRALIVLSTNGAPESFLGPLRAEGFTMKSALERDRGSEILTCWMITLRAASDSGLTF
ncbi:MAG: methyltransferase [Chloroflexi bacterium]|nr:methyltransferase [Chloroflexota bacterium]